MARRRWLSIVLALLVTVAGLMLLTPSSAAAGSRHHRAIPYAALGDSYAAGVGGGDYVDDECLQSPRGYPTLLDRKTRASLRVNVTCSGATTADVLADQVPALGKRIRLVTLTVGGNDLGFTTALTACAPGPSQACQDALNAARALLVPQPGGGSVLSGRLATTYSAIAAAAPKADILVTGYPYLFEPPSPDNPNAAMIAAVNDLTAALNATIRGTVAASSAAGVKIGYVDVTCEFAGHGVGSEKPYLQASGPAAFHPTPRGYRVYANELARSLSHHKTRQQPALVGDGPRAAGIQS